MKKTLLRFGKFIMIACLAIIVMATACLGLAWTAAQSLKTLSTLTAIFSQNSLFFTLFRWLVIIIFYCSWPWLVRKKSQACAWTEKKEDYWLSQRFRVITWLVIFEFFVCENLLWRFFHWL